MLGAGCIFSPDQDNNKPVPAPIIYPKRDSPQNALDFLQKAWSNKDSVRIAAVYADDYTGSSIDLTDPSAVTLNFLKSDEVRAVGGLALNQQIANVDMTFNSRDTWFPVYYPLDPSDWVTLQIPHFRIEVRDVQGSGFVANSEASGVVWIFEFTLKPTYPNGTSAAPAWEIVRWTESRATL